MANNVSAGEVSEFGVQIQSSVENLNTLVEDCNSSLKTMESSLRELHAANGEEVAGKREWIQVPNAMNGLRYLRVWTWKVAGAAEGIARCTMANVALRSIASGISELKLESSDIQLISEAIDGYIQQMTKALGEDISPKVLGAAFATGLAGKTAWDEYAAKDGKFVTAENLKTEYWTDKTLKFEKQPNGTYLIYQKNDNGNYVGMGFTTATTAVTYMSGLAKASGKESQIYYDADDKDRKKGYTVSTAAAAFVKSGADKNSGKGASTYNALSDQDKKSVDKLLAQEAKKTETSSSSTSDSTKAKTPDIVNNMKEKMFQADIDKDGKIGSFIKPESNSNASSATSDVSQTSKKFGNPPTPDASQTSKEFGNPPISDGSQTSKNFGNPPTPDTSSTTSSNIDKVTKLKENLFHVDLSENGGIAGIAIPDPSISSTTVTPQQETAAVDAISDALDDYRQSWGGQ